MWGRDWEGGGGAALSDSHLYSSPLQWLLNCQTLSEMGASTVFTFTLPQLGGDSLHVLPQTNTVKWKGSTECRLIAFVVEFSELLE